MMMCDDDVCDDDCGGDAKAAESKVDAQAAKRAKKAEENHLAHEKSEKLRQWNLTPPQLKLLLPGAGAITGQFWMRWHPLQHWWKVTYPSSTLSNLIRFVFSAESILIPSCLDL